MATCTYVWFRKTTGDETFPITMIVANHFRGDMEFSVDTCSPDDTDNYGVLEVSLEDFEYMQSHAMTGLGYGKHVDDPTGTPTLADGNPE